MVTVEVPVVIKLDARLTRDCDPGITYPVPSKMLIDDIVERLERVEVALAVCRNDKAELRGIAK